MEGVVLACPCRRAGRVVDLASGAACLLGFLSFSASLTVMRSCSRAVPVLVLLLGCFSATTLALCSTRQLDLTRLQNALDTCRKRATSPAPEPHRVLPTGTRLIITRRILTPKPKDVSHTPLPTMTPPPFTLTTTWLNNKEPPELDVTARLLVVQQVRRVMGSDRAPRSFSPPRPSTLSAPLQVNEAAGAWEVGARDKKCVFHCAFVELGLMDDEGRTIPGQLKSLLEEAARSTQLRARAAELAELCLFKMLHVSTIDETQLECDYPLMLTRCILGRLSKHCEEEEAARRRHQSLHATALHPDVEILD